MALNSYQRPRRGDSTGGGGLHFRSPADEFTGADLAACRVARNNYFIGTAAALLEFQGDQSLAITLNPANSTDNTFETYLPTTPGTAYDSTQWRERTDAIEGNIGPAGPLPSDAKIKVGYERNADTNVFSDAEKTKLATVETDAAADQTGAEIKAAYEKEDDTNAFTDALKIKLAGLSSSPGTSPSLAGTDAAARASIAAEITAREEADRAEAITRDAKDVALDLRITNETSTRAEKDTLLDAAVVAADAKAAAARVVADSGVLSSTANTIEIAAVKVTADAAQTAAEVDADVSVETTARIAADTALGDRITALPGPSGAPTRALYVGWSAAKNITVAATLSTSSDSHVVTIPAAVGNMYFGIWRADVDGGDPADVYLSGGGGNIRPVFGAATNFAIIFASVSVPGKLIVTEVKQSAPLWSDQVLRVG